MNRLSPSCAAMVWVAVQGALPCLACWGFISRCPSTSHRGPGASGLVYHAPPLCVACCHNAASCSLALAAGFV
jgi:hypothetical protein